MPVRSVYDKFPQYLRAPELAVSADPQPRQFRLTQKQHEAQTIQSSDATHVMLYGGSRSGKTLQTLRIIIIRALLAPKSRHAIFRLRLNSCITSIGKQTLPEVMELCFPDLAPHCKLNKQDWIYTLPNGSEIWLGGLDSKERTEKILGQEFVTIFLNECSQITWHTRNIVVSRLAQNVTNTHTGKPMRLKMFYDCNPPGKAHWTYKVFSLKTSPDTRKPLTTPEDYAVLQMNPVDNRDNLPEVYLRQLDNMSPSERLRFRDGLFADLKESALWTQDSLEQHRHTDPVPDMKRIIIAVDPSGCAGEEDVRSDEVGIVVAGLGMDGVGYVLEDLSGKHGPRTWAKIVSDAYERHDADAVVAEINFGGAMVKEVLHAQNPFIPFHAVRASRGKVARAEPISALYERGKVRHVARFRELEEQLCDMTTFGYMGDRSPDRADAAVWAIHALFPGLTKRQSHPNAARDGSPRQTRANTSATMAKSRLRRTGPRPSRARSSYFN